MPEPWSEEAGLYLKTALYGLDNQNPAATWISWPAGRLRRIIARRWSGAKNRRRSFPACFLIVSLRGIANAVAFFCLSVALLLALFRTIDPPATVLMVYRKYSYGWEIQKPSFTPLAKLPQNLIVMTLNVEDSAFFHHHGVIVQALVNAYRLNRAAGETLYGGSTITMQTARTLFLIPVKNYIRKALEIVIALEMELILGKERILELYMNYAEWGRGAFGVQAGALHHYGKEARLLSRDELIRLVALLPSPLLHSPSTLHQSEALWKRYSFLKRKYGSSVREEDGNLHDNKDNDLNASSVLGVTD